MSWQHLESGSRKARKEHRCYFCNEKIIPGEIYDFRTGVDLDGIYTMYMHKECHNVTNDWKQEDYETFDPGTLIRGKNDIR